MSFVDVPLGKPQLRWDDLAENATVYDRLVAAPSDEELHLMWTLSAIINSVGSFFIAVVLLAIVINKKTRRNPFDLYLVFLMVPDFWYSFQCVFTCMLSAIVGHYYSPAMCRWQGWYLIFGIAANAWINGAIAHEIYRMLRISFLRKRYFPPTRSYVAKVSCGAYAWSGFLSLWGILSIDWLPQRVDAQFGFVCVPVVYDSASTIFAWTCFFPLFVGMPYAFVFWVFYDVFFKRKLLPPNGRRRALTFYFVRIIFVFLVIWLPSLVVYFALRGQASPWIKWAFGMVAHLQGMISAIVTLTKDDIQDAVRDLVTCKALSAEGDDERQERLRSSRWLSSRICRDRKPRGPLSSVPTSSARGDVKSSVNFSSQDLKSELCIVQNEEAEVLSDTAATETRKDTFLTDTCPCQQHGGAQDSAAHGFANSGDSADDKQSPGNDNKV